LVRWGAIGSLLVGGAGSVTLTLWAGRHNSSALLAILFTAWVISPFAGLALADWFSRGWFRAGRAALGGAMIFLSVSSLAVYAAVALGPPRQRTAFTFLVMPAISWVVILAFVVVLGRVFRRRTGSG
jgi:hypothetical protein